MLTVKINNVWYNCLKGENFSETSYTENMWDNILSSAQITVASKLVTYVLIGL